MCSLTKHHKEFLTVVSNFCSFMNTNTGRHSNLVYSCRKLTEDFTKGATHFRGSPRCLEVTNSSRCVCWDMPMFLENTRLEQPSRAFFSRKQPSLLKGNVSGTMRNSRQRKPQQDSHTTQELGACSSSRKTAKRSRWMRPTYVYLQALLDLGTCDTGKDMNRRFMNIRIGDFPLPGQSYLCYDWMHPDHYARSRSAVLCWNTISNCAKILCTSLVN